MGDLHDIYLAGGCFWGVEEYFSRIPGVADAESGYANGTTDHPSYRDVCTDATGHAETVHVRYDPAIVSLETLLRQYFKIIDPISLNRQGNDVGTQYRTGIFFVDRADLPTIERVYAEVQGGHDVALAVEVAPLACFWPAEEEHQDYLRKHPGGYCHVSFESLSELPAPGASGRELGRADAGSPDGGGTPQAHGTESGDGGRAGNAAGADADGAAAATIDPSAYSRPTDAELRERLTPLQYEVTQHEGTEAPFTGAYDDFFGRGLYVDVVTGEPLFTSGAKFDSGCGWPAFARPIDEAVIVEHEDRSHGMVRTEVKSRVGESHLGHVFADGPAELGGRRYCIDSAALRFVAYDDMDTAGYGHLKTLVDG